MTDALRKLENQRAGLLEKLSGTGDMRRGTITENYRSCGKVGCACSDPAHPGHGPYYAYTFKKDGKTRTKNLRPSPQLEKLGQEVSVYRDFRTTCDKLVEVNEAICEARPTQAQSQEKKRRLARSSKPRSPKRSRSS